MLETGSENLLDKAIIKEITRDETDNTFAMTIANGKTEISKEVDDYMACLKERREIVKLLKNVKFIYKKDNTYVIKKDGNKLGFRKHHEYLELYFRNKQLKIDMNSTYGFYRPDKAKIYNSCDYYRFLAISKSIYNNDAV